MSKRIESTIPILASLNISESAAFYTTKLGFAERLRLDNYLIVDRDGAEIHFWLCADRRIAESTACYVRIPNAQAFYEEFRDRGLNIAPPAIRPWGMKEMYVSDPHGNLLKFGEDVPA